MGKISKAKQTGSKSGNTRSVFLRGASRVIDVEPIDYDNSVYKDKPSKPYSGVKT